MGSVWGFNPRARTGRDKYRILRLYPSRRFQSTRPHGARPGRSRRSSRGAIGFNPRARTGRDILRLSVLYPMSLFQSTRPHGARPMISSSVSSDFDVSIHAPARGATQDKVKVRTSTLRFNPRARTGRDTYTPHYLSSVFRVSIHAPARGATRTWICKLYNFFSFNPRARTGRDCKILL